MRRAIFVLALALLAACAPKPTQRQLNDIADAKVSAGLTARAAAADAAADKLVAAAKGYDISGAAPRQTDPSAGPLLDAVFDTSAIPLTTRTEADVQALGVWLQAVSKVGQLYVLAGTGVTDAPIPSEAVKAQSNRNLVAFAPELGRYFDAEVVLLSRQCATLYYLAAANRLDDEHRDAMMHTIQPAVEEAYRNVLGMIAIDGPSNAWKEDRARLLVAAAPRIASLLPANRQQTLERDARAVAAQTGDAALKAELNQLAAEVAPRL